MVCLMVTLPQRLALLDAMDDASSTAAHAHRLRGMDEATMGAILAEHGMQSDPQVLTQLRAHVSTLLAKPTELEKSRSLTRAQRYEQWMRDHVGTVQVALTTMCPTALLAAHPEMAHAQDIWPILLLTAFMPAVAKWICGVTPGSEGLESTIPGSH